MKRLAVIVLCIIFLHSFAYAEEDVNIIDYVKSEGFQPTASDNASGILRCDCKVASSRRYVLTWSDAEHVYTLSGTPDKVYGLYEDILYMREWQSCCLTIGNRARATYNSSEPARYACDTLEDFYEIEETLMGTVYHQHDEDDEKMNTRTDQTRTDQYSNNAYTYVLNTNTLVFHFPDCSSVNAMSEENKQVITDTKEKILSKGYSPCGRCNP